MPHRPRVAQESRLGHCSHVALRVHRHHLRQVSIQVVVARIGAVVEVLPRERAVGLDAVQSDVEASRGVDVDVVAEDVHRAVGRDGHVAQDFVREGQQRREPERGAVGRREWDLSEQCATLGREGLVDRHVRPARGAVVASRHVHRFRVHGEGVIAGRVGLANRPPDRPGGVEMSDRVVGDARRRVVRRAEARLNGGPALGVDAEVGARPRVGELVGKWGDGPGKPRTARRDPGHKGAALGDAVHLGGPREGRHAITGDVQLVDDGLGGRSARTRERRHHGRPRRPIGRVGRDIARPVPGVAGDGDVPGAVGGHLLR